MAHGCRSCQQLPPTLPEVALTLNTNSVPILGTLSIDKQTAVLVPNNGSEIFKLPAVLSTSLEYNQSQRQQYTDKLKVHNTMQKLSFNNHNTEDATLA